MKVIFVEDPSEVILGTTVERNDDILTFRKYYRNEYDTYGCDILAEVSFDDPADDFENLEKTKDEIERLRIDVIKEKAKELFPRLKKLYIETVNGTV